MLKLLSKIIVTAAIFVVAIIILLPEIINIGKIIENSKPEKITEYLQTTVGTINQEIFENNEYIDSDQISDVNISSNELYTSMPESNAEQNDYDNINKSINDISDAVNKLNMLLVHEMKKMDGE
ncbi:MAG: hypothetical protein JEZ07_14410 [Phycisphaerae bacterium]|nr:hypothetical protein [Phycisphaerae bacterium]